MEFISREVDASSWITLVILSCFVLLSLAKLINATQFSDFTLLFNSNKYLVLHQKGNRLSSMFNAILLLIQVFSVSLFLYFYFSNPVLKLPQEQLILYAKIFTIYLLAVICKLLIEKIIGTIFSIESIVDEYVFYKISYGNFFGILLLPLNMLFTYTFEPSKIVLDIFLGVLLFLNGVVLFLVYRKKEKLIINNLFYFILYLCALEIAPYFIVYKILV